MNLGLIFIVSFTLRGKIIDAQDNSPLAHTNVWIKGTTYGCATDKEGNFQLYLEKGKYEIVISRIGYKRKVLKIQIEKDTNIQIKLEKTIIKMKSIEVSTSGYTIGEGEKQILSRLDILREPGACADIFLMTKSLPAVTGESEIAPLWVRGGTPDEVLVLFNGTLFSYPYQLESVGGGMFSVVNEEMLSYVEFLPGAFPPRYGGKMSAVFDLKSKQFFGEQGLHGGIGLNMAGGSVNIYGRRYYVSFNRSYYELLAKFLDINTGDFTVYPNFYSLQIGATPWARTRRHWYLKSFSIIGGDDMGFDLTPQGFKGNFRHSTQKIMIGSQLLGLYNNFSIEISTNTNIYNSKKRVAQWKFDRKDNGLFYGLNINYKINSAHKISTGIECWFNWEKIDYIMPQEPYLVSVEKASTDTIRDVFNLPLYWGYIQCNSKIFGKNLLYGIRIGGAKDKSETVYDPRISITHKIGKWKFFAGIGKYSQYSSPMKLDMNPNLKPSYAIHYVTGVERKTYSYILKLDMYYKFYKHLFLFDTNHNPTSRGYGYSRGIEVFLKRRHGKFKPYIGYALLFAKRKEENSLKLVPFEYDTRHNLTISNTSSIVLFGMFPFDLGVKFKYLSGKPYTPLIGREVKGDTIRPIWGEVNSKRMPSYIRLDLRITSYGKLFGFPIVGFVEILNVLDCKNVIRYSWNVDYTKREEIVIMPRIIVGGFVWTF